MLEPILQFMNTALWNNVGLPRTEFQNLIHLASKISLDRFKIEQGDPVRLVEEAVKLARELIDQNKKIIEAKQLVTGLQVVEVANAKFFHPLSIKQQIERVSQKRLLAALQNNMRGYFDGIGEKMPDGQCNSGFALGRIHMIEEKYIQPKCALIRQYLLELRDLLPFDAKSPKVIASKPQS